MQAALEVGKVLRHSPAHIFNNMADRHGAGAGVFTAQEKLVVFPEYYQLKNPPECHGWCLGGPSLTLVSTVSLFFSLLCFMPQFPLPYATVSFAVCHSLLCFMP